VVIAAGNSTAPTAIHLQIAISFESNGARGVWLRQADFNPSRLYE
jgi:hypothetical protein